MSYQDRYRGRCRLMVQNFDSEFQNLKGEQLCTIDDEISIRVDRIEKTFQQQEKNREYEYMTMIAADVTNKHYRKNEVPKTFYQDIPWQKEVIV